MQLSGDGQTLNVKEDGDEELTSAEHNDMMQRRAELNRDLADLNGRLEDAEAYRKQLVQSSDGWSSIKQKYEVRIQLLSLPTTYILFYQENIKHLEKDVEHLLEEKAHLNQELATKNNSAASK